MKIVIAGGSGFLGNALKQYFGQHHEVIILTRKPIQKQDVQWDAVHLGDWVAQINSADVLINLTGKSVDCRYTEVNKKAILDSRILSTRILQEALESCTTKPKVWINASSATIYIHATTQLMNEYNGIIGDDFSMNICKVWEGEFFKTEINGLRKVAIRTSIVLGNGGGAFPKMKMLTKCLLGGHQGDGRQMMSWIHIEDFCTAIDYIIKNNEMEGAVNVTASHPVSNRDFMRAMRRKYNRSFGINQNRLMLEAGALMIGTEAELLLKSRNVFPEKLLSKGFTFTYPNVTTALGHL